MPKEFNQEPLPIIEEGRPNLKGVRAYRPARWGQTDGWLLSKEEYNTTLAAMRNAGECSELRSNAYSGFPKNKCFVNKNAPVSVRAAIEKLTLETQETEVLK